LSGAIFERHSLTDSGKRIPNLRSLMMIDCSFITGIGFLGMSIVFALYIYNGANIPKWEGQKVEVGINL